MFFVMDKLSKYEIETVSNELNPLFNNDTLFNSSTIYSKERLNTDIRDSQSAFPSLDSVFETSIILQLKAKEIFSKYIDFDFMTPDVQLLKYNEKQFYSWHTDVLPEHDEIGFLRIITMSLNVNDEYTGGGLEIRHDGKTHKLPCEKGSYCIFPSFLSHRAVAVETGCRKAVTLWIKGDEFRLNHLHELYAKQYHKTLRQNSEPTTDRR